jgi:DNA-directed RNA polymerase sigma subunit (sigma70/sigma32)
MEEGQPSDDEILEAVLRRIERATPLRKGDWDRLGSWTASSDPGTAALGRAMLIDALLRELVSVASRYEGRGVPTARLVRVGLGVLDQAVDRWRPEKGFVLRTYATWWIRQAITHHLASGRD